MLATGIDGLYFYFLNGVYMYGALQSLTGRVITACEVMFTLLRPVKVKALLATVKALPVMVKALPASQGTTCM